MDKVSMYAFDEMRTDLLYFWKKLEFFERHVPHGCWCRSVMEMHTKPISGKVPYYLFFCFVFPTSCYEYCVAHGNTWIIAASAKWSGHIEWGPSGKVGHQWPWLFSRSLRKKKKKNQKKNLMPHTQPEPGLPGAIYGCKHRRNCGLCTNALGSYLPVICQWLCLSDHSQSLLR